MPIRISDNYLSQILVSDLNNSLGRMLELQRQAGTMQRINDFADDPRAVGAIQRYNSLIAANTQYLRNVTRSTVVVEASDTALQDMSDLLAGVRELALRESNASANSVSRTVAAGEVDILIDRLMSLLNTSVEGNYVFGGTRTDTPPFVRNGSTVVYQGNLFRNPLRLWKIWRLWRQMLRCPWIFSVKRPKRILPSISTNLSTMRNH